MRRAAGALTQIARLFGVLVTVVAVVGCGATHDQRPGRSEHRGATAADVVGARTAPGSPQTLRAAAVTARGLSVDQLAGQRVIYAYAGLRPPPSLLTAVRRGQAGGVIFFSWNIASVAQIRGVIEQLQRASLASPLHDRLLMMTDQEGGEVRRLPGAPTRSEKQIGESRDGVALARAAGRGAAGELRSVGMNVNLAPVLDVYRHAGNFIDEFQRSYSGNPATVGRLGSAFIAAQQGSGVAATAKHFPGLGAAARSQDTDLRPVTLDVPLTQLRDVDEAPYRPAIAAGVKLVMVSWARYPALDRTYPAGLSSAVIQGELRGRLGFQGVTITDAIGAGALVPFGKPSQIGVMAAHAGADLILCAGTGPSGSSPLQGLSVLHALAAAIGDGGLTRSSAVASAARILALKAHP
ncbi:MAG TPA: glycoside hydrolase family 3 N-terminal domain-containing protein [Solirubrobacteraceae bacterium]|nr:glycoside hydrolase family 3 N-terminal domain-containing protein [Solirubrobacteraceae bacterium]